MVAIEDFFKNIYAKRVDSIGLSVFRIFYFTVLLCEVLQFLFFSELVFLGTDINFKVILISWAVCILFCILGIFSNYIYLINYLFTFFIIGTIKTYEYHMFYTYLIVNFLLIFIDSTKSLSLDSVIKRKAGISIDVTTSQMSYFSILFFAVGVVYLDSVFFKVKSEIWMSGLGLWLPGSLSNLVHLDLSFLLNQKYLMIFLSFLTLFFEFIFIFLFPIRKIWAPLFLIGNGLHFGILLFFPIPWFALGMMTLYLLLVPVHLWRRLFKITENSNQTASENIFIDALLSLTRSSQAYSLKLIKWGLGVLVLLQINSSLSTPLLKPVKDVLQSSVPTVIKLSDKIGKFSKVLFGMTPHGVFFDSHFFGYNHIFSIKVNLKDGSSEWLPILDSKGMVGRYLYSFVWAKWTFQSCCS